MIKFFKMGFLRKLVLYYSVVLLVFMFVLIGAAYRYIINVSEKTATINQIQLMEKTIAQVDSYLGEMDIMAQQVNGDSRIISAFSRLQENRDASNYFEQNIMENIEIGSILTSYNGPAMPIWRISVYNQYGDFISTGASVIPQSHVEEILQHDSINSLMNQLIQEEYLVIPPAADKWSGTYTSQYTSLLRPVTNYYAKEVYGVVEIQQSIDKLEDYIALNTLKEIIVFLFDEQGNQILPANIDYDTVTQGQYHVTTQTMEKFGWRVALAQDRQSMISPYKSMLAYLYVGGILMVIFLVLAVYLISRRISAPIIALSKKVRHISFGSIPPNLASKESTDEVMELNDAFSSMFKHLTDSIAYEKKAYLLALQSQMDPHFLYNSLSIISSMGLECGNDKIVDTCDKISSIMRYTSSYESFGATLQDEIENVTNYLELMKLRYEEYFSYSISVDENLRSMEMPRLVLQPIVENCFEHGFKTVAPPWKIDITAGLSGTNWFVQIADNGAGFSAEELEKLEQRVVQYSQDMPASYYDLKIGGLGLVNTIIRLKLYLDKSVEYDIIPNSPTGTILILRGVYK